MLNLVPQPGETSGFTPDTHLEVLTAHAPDLRIDVVLADVGHATDQDAGTRRRRAAAYGAEPGRRGRRRRARQCHDPERLAAAYARIMGTDGPGRDKGADRWR